MAEAPAKQAMKPPFPIADVPLDAIDLDLRNSRFPRDAQSQEDALELMLTVAGDDCLDLLRDLTRTGTMNSSDLPIVVSREDRYLMMEGNRRLTCLLLWTAPQLLNKHSNLKNQFLSRIERLISESNFDPTTTLRVAVAPSEDDADVWIERKHTGGAGGRGTVEWGPAMKDRRRARHDPSKASRAMAFVDLVSREYEYELDVQSALETVRTDRYTMIQRFVDSSVVRNMIRLDVSAGKMGFGYGAGATLPIIRAVLTDFAQKHAASGKTWARELDTNEDFRLYLEHYGSLLPHPISYPDFDAEKFPDGDSPQAQSRDTSQPTGQRQDAGHNDTSSEDSHAPLPLIDPDTLDTRPPRPALPQDYIFRGLNLNRFTNRIQEIVRQTSTISASRHNELVSVMLRVILDLTTTQFLKSHGESSRSNLDKNIQRAITIIEPTAPSGLGLAESTSSLQRAYHETTSNSIRLIQYALHDIHSGRASSEILPLADRYKPVLEAMNTHMGKHPIQ